VGGLLGGVEKSRFSTDLLDQMLNHITQFGITKATIRELKVVLVAVHTESFEQIVSRLVEAGLFLSQITILHAPTMDFANISVTSADSAITVEWKGQTDHPFIKTSNRGTKNLGAIVQEIMNRPT
jgi:hypothetical protein